MLYWSSFYPYGLFVPNMVLLSTWLMSGRHTPSTPSWCACGTASGSCDVTINRYHWNHIIHTCLRRSTFSCSGVRSLFATNPWANSSLNRWLDWMSTRASWASLIIPWRNAHMPSCTSVLLYSNYGNNNNMKLLAKVHAKLLEITFHEVCA